MFSTQGFKWTGTANMFLYLGTCHQLGGGQGALGGGSDDSVLKHSVLGNLGHILGLQHQHGGGVGHRFGQIHQDVLQQQQQVEKMETQKCLHNLSDNIFMPSSSTYENYFGADTEQIKVNCCFIQLQFDYVYSCEQLS